MIQAINENLSLLVKFVIWLKISLCWQELLITLSFYTVIDLPVNWQKWSSCILNCFQQIIFLSSFRKKKKKSSKKSKRVQIVYGLFEVIYPKCTIWWWHIWMLSPISKLLSMGESKSQSYHMVTFKSTYFRLDEFKFFFFLFMIWR